MYNNILCICRHVEPTYNIIFYEAKLVLTLIPNKIKT